MILRILNFTHFDWWGLCEENLLTSAGEKNMRTRKNEISTMIIW